MINFAMALHFHQPVGNFETVFERAYQFCYRPFLDMLSKNADIKMTIHISGCLLDFWEEKHPEALELIKTMVSRNQLELMAGGYYEPILSAIPERDLTGQIYMMSSYIKRRFGVLPKGMWVPERVWESYLIKPLYNVGIRYIILDDNHFFRSGIDKEKLHGYFLTTDEAAKIAIFPSDKTLRYTIPFKEPQESIEYLKTTVSSNQNTPLFTYGDDAEKFGEWPGTHAWVYENKWLEKFFGLLGENSQWLNTLRLSDYLDTHKPLGNININDGSYEEMMQWSGGNWMNFLSRYPEANQMHKKMFYVSSKISTAKEKVKKDDLTKLQEAERYLYKGQCNCGYWHGVFGGLYMFHLRNAIYQNLIQAEKLADDILERGKKKWLNIKEVDFNLDGRKKPILENGTFSVYIDTEQGGVIKELDYKPLYFNLINTLSRRQESYHQKILDITEDKHNGKIKTIHDDFRKPDSLLREKLNYDKFPRYFLRSYFVKEDLILEDFINSSFTELGDFSTKPYKFRRKGNAVTMETSSLVSGTKLTILKQVLIKSKKEIEFSFNIGKDKPNSIDALLGLEFNITMPNLNAEQYSYSYEDKDIGKLKLKGSVPAPFSFGISDSCRQLGIKFSFSERPKDLWYFPVETVSQSERAYELNYQCCCMFPRWKPNFTKKNSWDFKISLLTL